MNKLKKERNINIDYLKILAIFLIIISHSVPFYGNSNSESYINLNFATYNLDIFIMIILRHLGQIGNCIFMIITSYFLCDSNKMKINKIFQIIIDTFIFSILILLIILTMGINLDKKVIFRQLFPITYQNVWFVTVYVLIYFSHTLLNDIINRSNRKRLFKIIFVMFLLYSCAGFIIGGNKYYNNHLISFIMIYFIVAYCKKYCKGIMKNRKINEFILFFSLCIFLLFLVILNQLGLKINMFDGKMLRMNSFANPIIILISFSCFNIFSTLDLKKRLISNLSSITLYIYMIHENQLIRDYLKPVFFENYGCNLISVLKLFFFVNSDLYSIRIDI